MSAMSMVTRTAYLSSMMMDKNNSMIKEKRQQQQQHNLPWYHSISDFVRYLYMQFLLVTALYVMEPWERLLVLGVVFLILSLISYSALVYIPFHIHHILQSTKPNLATILTS